MLHVNESVFETLPEYWRFVHGKDVLHILVEVWKYVGQNGMKFTKMNQMRGIAVDHTFLILKEILKGH
jgi:hypothetical protein